MSSFEASKPVLPTSRGGPNGKRPPLTHRCSDPEFSDSELDDAVDMGETAMWANLNEAIYTDKNLEVFRPTQEESSLPIYCSKGWFPFSADTLFNTLLDIRYRELWDHNVDEVYVVEHQHESDVMYCAFKLPWPLANRDYVYRRRVKFYPLQNAFVILYQAAHHIDVPVSSTRTRVETCRLRLCIRNLASSHESCDFYLEYEDDTNFSLPNYLINLLLRTMLPSFMTKLHKACSGYAAFFHSIKNNENESMPSQVIRERAETPTLVIESIDPSDKKNVIRASATEERKPVRMQKQSRNSFFSRRTTSTNSTQSVNGIENLSRLSDDYGDMRRSEVSTDQSSRSTLIRHSINFNDGYLHHSSSAYNLESQFTNTPSEVSRVSSIDSAQTAPLDKDETLLPLDDDFSMKFRKQKIGLHLEMDLYSNKIIVAYCEKHSEAAGSGNRIEIGYLVTSVNGISVTDWNSTNVFSEIQRAKRPLTLGFSSPDREALLGYHHYHEPQNIVRCFITRANNILSLLRPFDKDEGRSAMLYRDFVASAAKSIFDSSHSEILSSEQTTLTSRSSTSLSHVDTERVLVPAGYLVYKINDLHVRNVPFTEIALLLERSRDQCIVTFKAAMLIVGNKQRSLKGRHHLSRRFPGIFRKKRRTSDTNIVAIKSLTTPTDNTSDTQNDQTKLETCELTDYSSVTVTVDNVDWVWQQVLKLKTTERVFSAGLLIDRLEAFLADTNNDTIVVARMKQTMDEKQKLVDYIQERRERGVKALEEFNNTKKDNDWQFGQTMLGVTTSWKPDEDGSVWIKLEGLVDGVDIFHTISVIREVDLYSVWIPFCSQSLLLQEMGHVELAAYLAISSPFLQRDAIIRAFGINAVYEHRCLLLLGGSVDVSTITTSVSIPTLQGWSAGRMEIKGFRALIEPLTRTQARTCIIANLDPKCAIPKAMLNFGIKKMAGILLYLIRKEAEKIELDLKSSKASAGNEHLCRITNDPSGFYTWLRPIVDKFFLDQVEKKSLDSTSLTLDATLEWTTDSDEPSVKDTRRKSTKSISPRPTKRRSTRISPLQRDGIRVSLPKKRSIESPLLINSHWSDYLYKIIIWPYVLVFLFATISTDLSVLSAYGLKLIFTCSCTFLAVPGAFSPTIRNRKRKHYEFQPLCRQYVVLAAIFDVLTSYGIRIWVHWIQCYVGAMLYGTSTFKRSTSEIYESEHFMMILCCFIYASAIVGMQIHVAVHM
ncbi:START domain-containing proteins involved in steroidogenesis/phosphatidylcholine transfer [Plasmopara halstedii]|uniref:Phosphatidylcholine transfer protein n=1 Tax=Plasmopara halstedii TaxID=4781 RepID=A0A0P1APA9_PLAHL|nr:START domain-containing proteins involved in steroidogenesis/phosphatidylcholine transfer [Plasmopara halstedii]CEG42944.1 START domain-containing proteins involved in steroidogenesis/phosphatidylcholine transfer [Plasmopara halstedii]|eukprot:XP_024579313.1 START domain-containing proteins involved in steroidogenesis/phosphatidylcholine transfer [Plasmopara halstedii]